MLRLGPACRVRPAPHAVAYPAPHLHTAARGGPRARARRGAASSRTGQMGRDPRAAPAPRRPLPLVPTLFRQAQLRVRVRVSLLLWRRAGPGGLRVHSASLRCAGARTRAALRGRPRRPRSPLRLTPKYPNPNFNPNPNPNQEPAARRAAPAACAERAEREERAMPRPARALHGGTWPPWATRGG